jgi:quinolinate synthase
MIATLPETYRTASETGLREQILAHKERLGPRLLILAHHYQRMEVVAIGDYVGDSYQLARKAAQSPEARDVVFCGVHFMAEAADILGRDDQTVYLPNATAGCPMADMAPIDDVLIAWDELESLGLAEGTTPVSYMNSAAYLKAFCGRKGGLICTSSNARAAFEWSFARREKVFFFPDQHLGRNTALSLGIPHEEMVLWDNTVPGGGTDPEALKQARVVLWKGHCHVHGRFLPEHVDEVRTAHPEVRVVVHPECSHEVVAKADLVGSTHFIVDFVEKAAPGSVIAIGTELNLIARLAAQHPDKKILELSGQNCPLCSNMFRTTLADVAYCLDHLGSGNIIDVPDDIKQDARVAPDSTWPPPPDAPAPGAACWPWRAASPSRSSTCFAHP